MSLFHSIDGLLRGTFTRPEDLDRGRIPLSVGTLLGAILVLGGIYGLFMGLYAVLDPARPGVPQLAATTAKVPLLFLLTLGVTFPSLYVFSALAGSHLRPGQTVKLLLVAVTVTSAILASLGPVTGFFTLSTDSYPFMKLLNVGFFTVAGMGGLFFLRRILARVFGRPPFLEPDGGGESPAVGSRALDDIAGAHEAWRSQRGARVTLRVWVVLYAAVGAQMGWILRPFIGAPGQPFELFRERESNIFVAIVRTLFGFGA